MYAIRSYYAPFFFTTNRFQLFNCIVFLTNEIILLQEYSAVQNPVPATKLIIHSCRLPENILLKLDAILPYNALTKKRKMKSTKETFKAKDCTSGRRIDSHLL